MALLNFWILKSICFQQITTSLPVKVAQIICRQKATTAQRGVVNWRQ